MPVAIVFDRGGAIPAILQEDTPGKLVAALCALKAAPDLKTEQQARIWLQEECPAPSGWFADVDEATAHFQRWRNQAPALTKDEVREARESLGMSQAEFAEAIGIGGNRETKRRFIVAVEKGEIQAKTGTPRVLSKDATQNLKALMAERGLTSTTD